MRIASRGSAPRRDYFSLASGRQIPLADLLSSPQKNLNLWFRPKHEPSACNVPSWLLDATSLQAVQARRFGIELGGIPNVISER